LKNSAYLLPLSPEAREDFEWVRNEVVASGGQATLLIARGLEQSTRDDIVGAFRTARALEYEALATTAAKLLRRGSASAKDSKRTFPQAVRRLREQFDEIARIDFFRRARKRAGRRAPGTN
jgi:hypothetical protein